MNEEDKNKRIQQMCSFIIQEAKEKVNEIALKTENDFALEKQMMVHQARLKLQQEFKQREKNFQTQKRVQKAQAETNSRIQLMHERERLVQEVKEEARQAAANVTKDTSKYKEIIEGLILQGLIKMNEETVAVLAKDGDKKIVEEVASSAVKKYKELIKKETGESVSCEVNVNPNGKSLPESFAGGVKVTADNGRLVLDNTLDSRVDIAFQQLMPVVRKTLFTTKV